MTRRGTDEVRRAARRLGAAQTAAFAASGVGVGLAPLPLSGGGAHGSWAGQGAALLGRVAMAALHASCRRGRALGRMLTIGAVGAAAGPIAVAGAQELASGSGSTRSRSPGSPYRPSGPSTCGRSSAPMVRPSRPPSRRRPPPRAAPARRPDGAAPLAVVALAAAQVAMVATMALAPTALGRHTGSDAAMAIAIAVHQLGMSASPRRSAG